MLAKNFCLLFYLKKSKNFQPLQPQPIYMRITVEGAVKELSVGRKWLVEKWNLKAGRAIGTKEEAKALNAYLDSFQTKVYEARRQLIENGTLITAVAIKDMLTGGSERPRLLLEIFQSHNEQMQALVGQEYAKGTLERYRTSLEHTRSFLQWKYKLADIDIKKLDFEFITDYAFWLKSVRRCGHNSTMKYLGNFKKIVIHCIKCGWLFKDPFLGFKMTKREVKREAFTAEELQVLSSKQFSTERLDQVRDIFLFCCFTGLAYADIKKLKRSEVCTGVDGEQWIFTSRKKTDTSSRIPLLPATLMIMVKYKDHPQCCNQDRLLPVLSNQKMNAYLKEIADVCGIGKNLTFHIARHTFATTVTLSNGVPIESVSKMLGHKNLRTTQHYAKILDQKVSEDMKALKQKLTTPNQKAIYFNGYKGDGKPV